MKTAPALIGKLQTLSGRAYFLLLSVLAFAMHFRYGLFYHWDEWNVLDRFFAMGPGAAFVAHNEHFLPLFFLTYFSELSLFGLQYSGLIAVSLLLHGINAYLLAAFLEKLAAPWPYAKGAARLIATLYLLSALHAETLQWAFEQSLQIRQILSFTALLAAIRYFERGGNKNLLCAALVTALAPFFFGSGLLLPFECALLFMFLALTQGSPTLYRRGAKLLTLLFLLLVPLLVVYYLNRKGAGHTVESMSLSGAFLPITFYIFCASQFGTVFRGLGLFPSLELNAAQAVLPAPIAVHIEAELFFAIAGTLISILLLGVYLRRAEFARKGALLWLFGQCWILLSFVLPALGRWQHGLLQSLSLRYQYSALLGLAIMLLPLLQIFLETCNRKGRNVFTVIGTLLLLSYLCLNTLLARNFDYYTAKGPENEKYISELLTLPDSADPAALKFPDNLAPGIHPLRLREIAIELANGAK